MFDAIAPRYDFLNHLLSCGIDRRWRRRAIKSLQLTGRECVLDLCTGTADLAIAARSGAARVIGMDFAMAMLRVGQAKLGRAAITEAVTLVRADATRIPLVDRSVDRVAIAFGIRNVEDPAAAVAEIRRVLAPGGRLAILEFAIPATAGIRAVYLWYFKHVLPRIGRIVSRHPAAYDYLPASVSTFTTPSELVKILRHAGFSEIEAVPLSLGAVFLYTGRCA